MTHTDRARIVTGAGILAVVIGAFMPWVKVTGPLIGTVTAAGTDGSNDGWFSLVAAALALVAVLWLSGTPRFVLILIGGLGALGVGLYDWNSVNNHLNDLPSKYIGSVGVGLWLTIAGGIAILVGAVMIYAAANETVDADDPAQVEQ